MLAFLRADERLNWSSTIVAAANSVCRRRWFAAPATTRQCKRRFPNRFPKLEWARYLRAVVDRAGNEQDGYAVLLRYGIGSGSVFGFKDDDDARRFGFVRPQTRQSRIAPARKTDNFTSLTFHFRRFGGLQDVETAAVEKEGMIPKQVVQFGNRGMAIGKNLGIELAQGLVHLCRV